MDRWSRVVLMRKLGIVATRRQRRNSAPDRTSSQGAIERYADLMLTHAAHS